MTNRVNSGSHRVVWLSFSSSFMQPNHTTKKLLTIATIHTHTHSNQWLINESSFFFIEKNNSRIFVEFTSFLSYFFIVNQSKRTFYIFCFVRFLSPHFAKFSKCRFRCALKHLWMQLKNIDIYTLYLDHDIRRTSNLKQNGNHSKFFRCNVKNFWNPLAGIEESVHRARAHLSIFRSLS